MIASIGIYIKSFHRLVKLPALKGWAFWHIFVKTQKAKHFSKTIAISIPGIDDPASSPE